MFAQSYDPLGCKRQLSPRSYENHKRLENTRRQQRMIEADRRRHAELEHETRRMKKLREEERRRQMDVWQCQIEEDEEMRRHHLDFLLRRDYERMDSFVSASSSPPAFIYACVSPDETDHQDNATYPPRTASRHEQKQGPRRRADTIICGEEHCTICKEERKEHSHHANEANQVIDPNATEVDEEVDASVPPHIMAKDRSDDEEEDDDDEDDLNSLWKNVSFQSNDTFQTL